jgi:thiol-disulfide isomerase/thioredoxin
MRSSMKARLKVDPGRLPFRRTVFRTWIFVFLLALTLSARAQTAAPYGYGLNGAPIDQLDNAGTKLVVLFFTATDCPISNRYIPEIERLQKLFAADGVIFWYAYPNLGETAGGVRQHEVAYGAEGHVLLDPQHRLVDLTRAKVTPEVVILVPGGASPQGFRVVYRGRIDNRYIHFGVQRPAATQHDLEEAIADVLHHEPVHQPDGPPIGCSIVGQP